MNNLAITQFRGFPANYQRRPHVCREFIRLFGGASEIDVLVLEARPGIGATSLAAEYLETLEEPGILLSVNTGSRAGYSLPFLIDQALQQAYALLEEDSKRATPDALVSEWHRTLPKLQRLARGRRSKLHIVVDGLYQIPADDERYLQEVVRDVLALGHKDVRHVFTWKEGGVLPKFLSRLHVKSVPIQGLSEAESRSVLEGAGINDSDRIDEIIDATEGVPAMLASICRLHKQGILDSGALYSKLADYYDLEWDGLLERHQKSFQGVDRLFAFLIFSKKPLTVEELAAVLGEDVEKVRSFVCVTDFVDVVEGGKISFLSNTHREYIKARLDGLRTEVLNTFVEKITANPSRADSIQLLPNYYEELGRDSEIVELLTPENLDAYLDSTQSLTALRRRNELGFQAAKRESLEIQAYRFSLQTSIVRSLESCEGNEARLAALASTGRLEAAFDYAQRETTKEAKLLLLSQYAKALYSRGVKVDDVLAESIQSLIREVDLVGDKDRTLTIAENLIGPFPEIGIALVEQSSEGAKDFQDAAFTHLILKAQSTADGDVTSATEKYVSKVSNSRLQRFLVASEIVFKEKSAEEIKRITAGLDGGQRSFLLRQWLKTNSKHEAALSIADFALDEVARDSAYLPSAADLRDICLPLAYTQDDEGAKSLLSRIEAQRSAMLEAAGTVEKFRLDLEIARTKTAFGMETVDDVLSDLYVRASYLTDDGVKLECFSWMRSSLSSFKKELSSEVAPFVELCEEAIKEATNKCLATTGEHLDVFKGAMIALLESDPEAVLQLVEKLNTQDRRDSAYSLFVEGLISRRSKEPICLRYLLKALGSIVNPEVRWPATVTCLRLLAQLQPALDTDPKAVISLGVGINDPLGKVVAWRWIVPVSAYYKVPIDLVEATSKFKDAAEHVDQIWRLPELSYWYVDAIAKVDRRFANDILDEFERWLRSRQVVSSSFARLVYSLAKLSVIAFTGVIQHRAEAEDELSSVFAIIDSVPSTVRQADLYVDLALRAFVKGRKDVFEQVCDKKISKIADAAPSGSYLKQRVAEVSFVAIFLWNQPYAEALLESLSVEKQDVCRREVVLFHATGNTIYEPYRDALYRSARLTYPVALLLVSLIEKMSDDSCLAHSIEILSCAATSKPSVNEINGNQRAELAQRLLKKAERDLPDRKNIKHDGWKILCRACCLRLSGEGAQDKWKSVLEAAKALPNLSDAVYVLTVIASALPRKLSAEKALALNEAEQRVGLIPSLLDRVRRSVAISNESITSEIEQALAKRLLTKAMTDTFLLKDHDVASEAQKEVIDLAYQIDKEFASELVRMIDNDPARIRAKAEASERMAALKCKATMVEKRCSDFSDDVKDLGGLAWDMLGSLNAGKVAAKNLEELAPRLAMAHKRDLFDVLGFYQWYLRNLQEKYKDRPQQSNSVLHPLFEVTRLAALMAEKIGNRVCGRAKFFTGSVAEVGEVENCIVVPGVREDGLAFINKWLDTVNDAELLICDPFFKPDDIDFIKTLSFHKEGVAFVVLSCAPDSTASGDLESEFRQAWSRVAHVEPPPLRAVYVTYDGDKAKHPVHDRWVLCGTSGLRIGTSIGSLGVSKLTEISQMSESEAIKVRTALDPFVQMRENWIDSKRLRYRVVQW